MIIKLSAHTTTANKMTLFSVMEVSADKMVAPAANIGHVNRDHYALSQNTIPPT